VKTIRLLFLLALPAAPSFGLSTISAILNIYSYTRPGSPNYGIAQGSIFAIAGTGLSKTTSAPQRAPLPSQLEGVMVQVGGTDGWEDNVPLYYVSPTSIVGVLPSYFPPGPATLAVFGKSVGTDSVEFKVVQSAFGIATLNGSSLGAAIAFDTRSQLLGSSNSAKPGDIIQILGTGAGTVTGDESIQQIPADLTKIPMDAEIGGVPARILYRGRTGTPGLDRIDIEIPNLSPEMFGCYVPLLIKSGDISSNATTIPAALNGGACPTINTGTSITQEEIDRWSAAGTYTVGSLFLGNGYFHGTFARLSRSDVARFLRNAAGVVASSAGQCSVDRVGSNPGSNTYPNLESSTDLDAGPSISFTGPRGSQVLPRDLDHFGDWGYDRFAPENSYLTAGRYTFTGQGGRDVGSFFGTPDVPDFAWTNQEEAQVVTRADGVTVRWGGGDSAQLVNISGHRSGSGFTCYANNSAGQFTVPAEILNQIPPTQGLSYLYVSTSGPGTRLQASGVDYFTAVSYWGFLVRTEYR
jgi:uncharacterized protein (TIGR03437 family)